MAGAATRTKAQEGSGSEVVVAMEMDTEMETEMVGSTVTVGSRAERVPGMVPLGRKRVI